MVSGISIDDDKMVVIIPKNSVFPIKKDYYFSTKKEYNSEKNHVCFNVYEGKLIIKKSHYFTNPTGWIIMLRSRQKLLFLLILIINHKELWVKWKDLSSNTCSGIEVVNTCFLYSIFIYYFL